MHILIQCPHLWESTSGRCQQACQGRPWTRLLPSGTHAQPSGSSARLPAWARTQLLLTQHRPRPPPWPPLLTCPGTDSPGKGNLLAGSILQSFSNMWALSQGHCFDTIAPSLLPRTTSETTQLPPPPVLARQTGHRSLKDKWMKAEAKSEKATAT